MAWVGAHLVPHIEEALAVADEPRLVVFVVVLVAASWGGDATA